MSELSPDALWIAAIFDSLEPAQREHFIRLLMLLREIQGERGDIPPRPSEQH